MGSGQKLPPVTVLEIVEIDGDSDGIGVPVEARLRGSARITVKSDRRPGRGLKQGDRILARLHHLGRGKYDAQVMRRLPNRSSDMFGMVAVKGGSFVLEPVERGARNHLELVSQEGGPAIAEGDMVEAETLDPDANGWRRARAVRNLGPASAPGAYSILAIAEFGIRHEFPREALAEAKKAREPVLGKRADLRDIPLVTIDGADARDFDDAVFAEPLGGGGHRILVAIADVAHYVAEGGALDREAALRGNSVYFPDRVVPMLPEALSNDLCSLVPGEDRACLAVEMEIDAAGVKQGHRFMRGLMRSHARLTYDAVEDYHNASDASPPEGVGRKTLDALFAAYECLAGARRKRGALELDIPEKRVRFDGKGKAVAIDRKSQSTSQKLIEEFMILANVCAAETLEEAKRLCVYRAHEPPSSEKLDDLHRIARAMGLAFPRGQVMRARNFNALLDQARSKGEPHDAILLSESVLRSQSQADYRISNPGHFGLALRRYAHFTSPIRRYADLMVHRQIAGHLEKREDIADPAATAETASAISDAERQAAAAERRTVDRFAASLMAGREGQVADGRIISVTSFGAFVELEESGIEGLLPLRRMLREYYDVDTLKGVITGEDSGITLRVGDALEVEIEEVSAIKGTLALKYRAGGGSGGKRPGSRPGKAGSPRKKRGAGRPSPGRKRKRASKRRR